MPAKRDVDRVLGDLERRMDELEASAAREAERVARWEYSDEDIIEICLGLLAYVYGGDKARFADHFVSEGVDAGEASKFAEYVGDLLEERRRIAPDPQRPV